MSSINEYFHSLRGKRIAVIGMGVSNTPLIRMLLREDLDVTVRDKAARERVEEVAEELELDPFTTIQYTISGNRLIIEAIDAEQSMVCFGNCCRCPGRNQCESAYR